MDFREIVRSAAKAKLICLTKVFLDILDELRKEDAAKVEKFISIAEENGLGEQAKILRPFLFLLDDNKKEALRKRVLDRANELARELDQ
jgi:hypothetical protein